MPALQQGKRALESLTRSYSRAMIRAVEKEADADSRNKFEDKHCDGFCSATRPGAGDESGTLIGGHQGYRHLCAYYRSGWLGGGTLLSMRTSLACVKIRASRILPSCVTLPHSPKQERAAKVDVKHKRLPTAWDNDYPRSILTTLFS